MFGIWQLWIFVLTTEICNPNTTTLVTILFSSHQKPMISLTKKLNLTLCIPPIFKRSSGTVTMQNYVLKTIGNIGHNALKLF